MQFKLSVIITKCSINMDEVNQRGERKRDNEEKKKEREEKQRVFASVRKEREEK